MGVDNNVNVIWTCENSLYLTTVVTKDYLNLSTHHRHMRSHRESNKVLLTDVMDRLRLLKKQNVYSTIRPMSRPHSIEYRVSTRKSDARQFFIVVIECSAVKNVLWLAIGIGIGIGIGCIIFLDQRRDAVDRKIRDGRKCGEIVLSDLYPSVLVDA